MARRSATRATRIIEPATVPAPAIPAIDPGVLVSQWLEGQRALFGASFEQMTQAQQMLFQSWVQLMQAYWAPWTPFLERGGEQLA